MKCLCRNTLILNHMLFTTEFTQVTGVSKSFNNDNFKLKIKWTLQLRIVLAQEFPILSPWPWQNMEWTDNIVCLEFWSWSINGEDAKDNNKKTRRQTMTFIPITFWRPFIITAQTLTWLYLWCLIISIASHAV